LKVRTFRVYEDFLKVLVLQEFLIMNIAGVYSADMEEFFKLKGIHFFLKIHLL